MFILIWSQCITITPILPKWTDRWEVKLAQDHIASPGQIEDWAQAVGLQNPCSS